MQNGAQGLRVDFEEAFGLQDLGRVVVDDLHGVVGQIVEVEEERLFQDRNRVLGAKVGLEEGDARQLQRCYIVLAGCNSTIKGCRLASDYKWMRAWSAYGLIVAATASVAVS